jgi:hypothetical protein
MARQIKIDRRYSLGDYKYITLFDEIDVDDTLMYNQDVIDKLRFLQILSMEVAYRKYLKLVLEHPHTSKDIEEGIKALEEIQVRELNTLKDIKPELANKINGINVEE